MNQSKKDNSWRFSHQQILSATKQHLATAVGGRRVLKLIARY